MWIVYFAVSALMFMYNFNEQAHPDMSYPSRYNIMIFNFYSRYFLS